MLRRIPGWLQRFRRTAAALASVDDPDGAPVLSSPLYPPDGWTLPSGSGPVSGESSGDRPGTRAVADLSDDEVSRRFVEIVRAGWTW
jgi:hypothetical protein